MAPSNRQLKISKLFRKGGGVSKHRPKPDENYEELQEEIKQLEEELREKQNEFFQLLRNGQRRKVVPKSEKKNEAFIRPRNIVLKTQIESLSNKKDLAVMLTGVEVQSFVARDHCCVVFHMQHNSELLVKHGLRVEMKGGLNEISSSHLPLGFNLNAVMEEYDNVKKPQCLMAIRKALFAYYDRLGQFENLKKLVNMEAELFRTLDTSHIEITLSIQNEMDEEEDAEIFRIAVLLDYRVYDIRPKYYALREPEDLPDDMVEAIMKQCAIFKKQPLHKAFKEAFVTGIGHYKLVQQFGALERPRREQRRKRPRYPQQYNNDDTFRPEECSEIDEDDEDME